MAAVEGVGLIAAQILEGATKAGATRHVAAAVAAPLLCVCCNPVVLEDVTAEVQQRLAMVRPALEQLTAAGAAGEAASLSGSMRAFRNCAKHAALGQGVAALPRSGADAKRMQRGGRKQGEFKVGPAVGHEGKLQEVFGARDHEQPGQAQDALEAPFECKQECPRVQQSNLVKEFESTVADLRTQLEEGTRARAAVEEKVIDFEVRLAKEVGLKRTAQEKYTQLGRAAAEVLDLPLWDSANRRAMEVWALLAAVSETMSDVADLDG